MFCSNCGSENPKEAQLCSKCNAELIKASPDDSKPRIFCPKCGADNPEGALFCRACGEALPQKTTPPPQDQPVPLPLSVGYAGFWRRFVAIIIDGIILGVVNLFITQVSGCNIEFGARPQPSDLMMQNFPGIIISWLYFALMESSKFRGTVGKMALGIVVTDLNGYKVSFGKATGRYFGKYISTFTLMIGFMMAGFTARKQALHDMMAGCLVLVKR